MAKGLFFLAAVISLAASCGRTLHRGGLLITTGYALKHNMKKYSITTTYDIIGIILGHPDYVKTKCGQIINIKKGMLVKHTFSGSSTGYYLNGKFVKDVNIKIDTTIIDVPF